MTGTETATASSCAAWRFLRWVFIAFLPNQSGSRAIEATVKLAACKSVPPVQQRTVPATRREREEGDNSPYRTSTHRIPAVFSPYPVCESSQCEQNSPDGPSQP